MVGDADKAQGLDEGGSALICDHPSKLYELNCTKQFCISDDNKYEKTL